MRIFITVVFVLYILEAMTRICYLASDEYPRKKEYGVGFDTATLVVGIAFIAWAAYLLRG